MHEENIITLSSVSKKGRGDTTKFLEKVWFGDEMLKNRFPRLYYLDSWIEILIVMFR